VSRVRPFHRRCFVLIAMLVVIGSSLLVATSLLFVAQTEVAVSVGTREAAQARALAWSGVQAVMAQLRDQRDRILRGDLPAIDDRCLIYEHGLRVGMVRLLPVSGHAGDSILVPEAGKLDVNAVDAAAMALTGCMAEDVAQAIVSYRDAAPGARLHSTADLLRVPGAGVTAETLYGSLSEITVLGDVHAEGHDRPYHVMSLPAESRMYGWADVLTVHAVEPSVQMSGEPCINVTAAWSDELERQVTARFGGTPEGASGGASRLMQVLEVAGPLDSGAGLIQALRSLQIAPEDWPPFLDAFCTSSEPLRVGRLDINTASFEALSTLPSLTRQQAAQMVRLRGELSADERASIAWPMLTQIISPEQFEALVDHITTRSWTYRIRLAAGEATVDEPHAWTSHPVIYEVVIDLSGRRPRVAYLRDITVLQETSTIAAESRLLSDEAG
jgi:DNA uptake protein ComE-like DNA-binding protein